MEALATPGPIFLTADTASEGIRGTCLVLQHKDYYRKKAEESGKNALSRVLWALLLEGRTTGVPM